MFADGLVVAALAVLVMLSVGGIAYVMFFSSVNAEAQVSRRLEAITDRQKIVNERRDAAEASNRRKNIQSAFKEFEQRQKARSKRASSPPLSLRLQQAGLTWSKRTFFVFSICMALLALIVTFAFGQKLYVCFGAAVVIGLGLPRWFISFLRRRRMNKFLLELPNAVDVIVRGIKSGLPLGDCLRIVAQEAREPVRSEFRYILEQQQLGITVGEAVGKLYDRMPVQEANFFGIVIAIQQKAGGNLSEALGNLSKVLRERKKLKDKIKAISQEAKASAGIIGSLPIIVAGLVSVSSPTYLKPLFVTSTGNLILGGSALMMFTGVLVMRKMINFEL